MSRANTLYSLGIMPAMMGLGHLAPAIGAIETATGSYQFPISLLGLIASISGLVDSIDTYKDVPLSERPRSWVWRGWKYGLWAIVVVCTWLSGLQTALLIYRVLPLGLLWGARCIPVFYRTGGFSMQKPKTLLGEGKSLVVAICMASVTAGSSGAYFCNSDDSSCSHEMLRARSFQLACLYQFFRETTCDVRDIKEDAVEGLATLPVMLGKRNTMLFMTLLGLVLDALLTQSIAITPHDAFIVRHTQLAYSFLRIGSTMAAYSVILRYPRDSHWAWGIMSLFGLVPVMFAQAALRS